MISGLDSLVPVVVSSVRQAAVSVINQAVDSETDSAASGSVFPSADIDR